MKTRDFLNLTAGDRVKVRGATSPTHGTVKGMRIRDDKGDPTAVAVVTWDNNPRKEYEHGAKTIELIFERPDNQKCKVCQSCKLTYAFQWEWQSWDSDREVNVDEMTIHYLCWSCGQAFSLGQMRPEIKTHRLVLKVN